MAECVNFENEKLTFYVNTTERVLKKPNLELVLKPNNRAVSHLSYISKLVGKVVASEDVKTYWVT